MKKILQLLIFLALSINFDLNAQSRGIHFSEVTTWDDILTTAKQEGKNILIDVYASWCIPCQKMEKEVFSIDSIGNFVNNKYISIRIQSDSTKYDNINTRKKYALSQQIVKTYKIKSIPTLLFFDANGKLLHREQGYQSPDMLVSVFKTAEKMDKNFASLQDGFKRKSLQSKDLVKYALLSKRFGDDSLATEVAKYYAKSLTNTNIKEAINHEFILFMASFNNLFNENSQIVKYLFEHKPQCDSAMNQKGASQYITDLIITNNSINPEIERRLRREPNWKIIRKKIANTWNQETADRLILNNKISFYAREKKWDKAIKYQIQKIEQDNSQLDMGRAFEINNFVWGTILQYSSDIRTLEKACKYMESIITTFPEDHQSIDTYANVLYKSGQKEKALSMEKKALLLAQTQKDNQSYKAYVETIGKMEKGIPTWVEQ